MITAIGGNLTLSVSIEDNSGLGFAIGSTPLSALQLSDDPGDGNTFTFLGSDGELVLTSKAATGFNDEIAGLNVGSTLTPTNLVHIPGQVVTVTSPPTGSGTTGTVELLPLLTRAAILVGMFSISDADVAAIVAASERGGQFAATVEVRRLFPGIPDNAEARRIALIIAGWEPMPANPREP